MPHRRKPERIKTDASLAHERTKTDAELMKRRRVEEHTADTVIATARKRARDVLTRARGAADEKLRRKPNADERRVIADERAAEDATLSREHESADEALAAERTARRMAMKALLANERETTDAHLKDERRRSDADLAARDAFLAMVSHDLRNTLAAVGMSASALLARRDTRVRSAVEEDAQRIQHCVVRLDRLVRDLLDLATIQAGRLIVDARRREVLPLVQEAREMFRPLAAAKGISLDVDVRRGLVARCDDGRIFQVLDNLLGNALKFTPRGGRIRIDVATIGRDVRFGVSDSGPGIRADDVDGIFERYARASDDLERGGLGLGLHISKSIVEAHGGKIWIENRSGNGATVYFTVPSASPVTQRRRPRRADARSS